MWQRLQSDTNSALIDPVIKTLLIHPLHIPNTHKKSILPLSCSLPEPTHYIIFRMPIPLTLMLTSTANNNFEIFF